MRILVRRLVFYVVTVWAAITVNFVLPRIMPGDPVTNLIQKFRGRLSPEAIKAIKVLFGQPDRPLWQQYLDYWSNLFHGNFGISYAYYPTPVLSVIGDAIPWTLWLITVCTVLGFLLGTLLGTIVGWRRGSWLDLLVPVTTFVSSIPYFWFAIIVVLIFAITLRWFPLSGGYAFDYYPSWDIGFIGSALYYAVLPGLTIIVSSIGGWLLSQRNMMITTLSEDYVRMAEAKGLGKYRIMLMYAARNAMLPNFAGFAMALGFVVSGSIVTEIVFNYPGIGSILFRAAAAQDYPLMQAIFLAITVAVLVANIVADLLYAALDPRTREEG